MSNDQFHISEQTKKPSSGPFLARVISHMDATYMGILQVEILRDSGGTGTSGQLIQAKYMSPFYGVTGADYVKGTLNDQSSNTYNNTQKAYGMWMVPPDVGTTVIVFFIDGDPRKCYWMGCVLDESMNFAVPGLAATQNNVEGTYTRAPVAEYNKKVNNTPLDPTKIKKPTHPLADVLNNQGLINDDIRGITTSSARREVPSMVFGISTPGPIDKQDGATRGSIGKSDFAVPNAFVSRLGGSTFVMDDGDDKFLRTGPASTSPPTYAAVEQNDLSGNVTIPHNELIRIRTRTGHQILLHNSEDLIYITNSRGTAWIELTSNGKIDIYAQDSISLHTENDFNITADRDINFTAGNNINLNASVNFNATAGTNYEIKAGADGKLTVDGNTNILSGGNHIETAANIHMNGPTAATAQTAPKAGRIPETEPWAGHENLDPSMFTPDNTQATDNPTTPAPAAFGMYTTVTDPFNKISTS
jgi:hypothetical protein